MPICNSHAFIRNPGPIHNPSEWPQVLEVYQTDRMGTGNEPDAVAEHSLSTHLGSSPNSVIEYVLLEI